jgi:competence protein ComEC
MTLGYLALCLAAGIVWADAGGEGVLSAIPIRVLVCIAAALCVIGRSDADWLRGVLRFARRAISGGDPGPRDAIHPPNNFVSPGFGSLSPGYGHREGRTILWHGLLCLLTGVIAFDAGSIVLAERLREAVRGRTRAAEAGQQGLRMAEARVVARLTRSWGDDIELSRVRAADGGTPLPERVILRVRGDSLGKTALDSRTDGLLRPGTQLRLALRILPIHAQRNPGSVDREGELARRGIAARGRLIDPNWVVERSGQGARSSRLARQSARWRADARRPIGARLASWGDSSGLVRALSLGDRQSLAPGVAADFRALGLSHLLAISGLHVGMVAGLLGWLTLRLLVWVTPSLIDPFPWVLGIAVLGSGGYAWLVGGSVSVRRAWCCLLVVAVFAIARRSPRPIELLSGIAIVLWVQEPSMVFDLGAQLSFAACLGLIAAGVWRGPVAGRREANDVLIEASSIAARLRRNLGLSVRGACSAGFATAAVLASHGLPTAFWAPAANAIAVPWTAMVVLPASLGSALLAFLLDTAIGPESVPSSAMTHALTVLLWPALGLVDAAGWCAARLPGSPLEELGSPLLVAVAALLGLAALRAGWIRSAALCWVLLAFAGGVPRADDGVFAATPRVWFFDVGQGDASLVEGRSGAILIDAGPGSPDGSGGQALVRSLRALGRKQLDVFVLTHADLDHRGGAIRVLERLDVGEMWLPEAGRGDPALDLLVKVAGARGTRVLWRSAESAPAYHGDLRIDTLWPPRDLVARSRNAGSLVLRVGVGGRSVLFLADVDAAIELALSREAPLRVKADYLKVSHHGSRGGTHEGFLEFVAARHAFVSAPCTSGRGLPNPGTLDRIRRSGTRLWWTGRDGALALFPERFESEAEVVAWARPRECSD